MALSRRDYLQLVGGALAAASAQAAGKLGIPGPYRGKVVGVAHSNCLRDGAYQAEPVREMLNRGMRELTGASDSRDAWRKFFKPHDTVGIKISPVGQPYICSSAELLHAILDELQSAGVKPANITVFERYRQNIVNSPCFAWVPKNIRVGFAAEAYDAIQQAIEGYDPECFVDLPFTLPGFEVSDKAATRSHASLFISKHVTKLINLPVLKSHNGAGVTLALKNLSHGLVNNVSRSHDGPQLRLNEFIPPVLNMPAIRQKTVLNILDGTKALCHGGPGMTEAMVKYMWEHKTLYFATDPVAMDIIGRGVIEAQRKKVGLFALADRQADEIWKSPYRQPEHIERAGAAGLGESDLSKIHFKQVDLG